MIFENYLVFIYVLEISCVIDMNIIIIYIIICNLNLLVNFDFLNYKKVSENCGRY